MKKEKVKKENKIIKKILDEITGIFMPIIGCITGASIIKSVLMILTMFGLVTGEEGLYRIFYAVSDGFFFFLPFVLAMSASRRWKTDPYISLLIPVTMFYPDILDALEAGGEIKVFGLGLPSAIYHSSVIPVLLAMILLIYVEKFADRILPEAIKGMGKPIICALIVLPVTFAFLGPLGSWIGSAIASVFLKAYELNRVVAGVVVGALIQPMVSLGAHWSIVPICMNNITKDGYDAILPLVGSAVYGQAGAVFAVALIAKNKERKRTAYQATVAAILGVTEPALFGVNLPLIRPMVAACAAGAIGGGLIGFAGTLCTSFAFPSILTCVAYLGGGTVSFIIFLCSMALGFVLGFIFTFMQKKKIMEMLEEECKDEK